MSPISKIVVGFAYVYYAVIPLAYLATWWLGLYDPMTGPSVILVTGAAGYIGSHTVVELLNGNYTVVAIDNMLNAYLEDGSKIPESLKRVEAITNKTVTFYNVDLRDSDALDGVFKNHPVSCVIHFAGLKAVGESVKKPLLYYENNVGGTCTLLQVMQNNNVKRIVFSSSATVYGDPQFLPVTEDHPVGQGCTNPYGKTKYFIEEILKDVSKADKVAVGRREAVEIFGNNYDTPDGTGVRDYIHITDLAVGHIRALEKINTRDFAGWRAYNLGTGKGYSVLEMIKAFAQASDRNVTYQIAKPREGDIATTYADPMLARKELNWSATKNINDMCRDTWNWQWKNPNGYHSNP